MDIYDLKNKTILITGASNGIGKACAILCAEAGAKLILTGRNKERLESTVNESVPQSHQTIIADISVQEGREKLCESISHLDGLVHSAGIVFPMPVQYMTPEKINNLAQINYYAPVEINRILLRKKKINKGASIVFLSSISSGHPFKGGAIYCSFKAALESYSKSLALELAPKGIRSNCIKAGLVETNIMDVTANATTKESLENHRAQYPLGFGSASDVANSVLFLLSNASGWITGTDIILDGGLTISKQ